MKELDLNDVRMFVSVAQAGTLTAAAKELHCPASTLSRALTRLEKTSEFCWCSEVPEASS